MTTFKIAFVSTYPPRECGIATFTQDLATAFDDLFYPKVQTSVIAMTYAHHEDTYSDPVITTIQKDDLQSYISAAELINQTADIKCVHVQHEFGIFGGKLGKYLLTFLQALKKPSAVTMHTVLPLPHVKMLNVIKKISTHTNKIIVMTEFAKNILIKDYQLGADKIAVIPHGIHPWPYSSSRKNKIKFGYANKIVLSTFGFLGRGKGIEYVIESLPKVIEQYPDVVYLVFGKTHPNLFKQEGEAYRDSLIQQVEALNLTQQVIFYNEYFSLNELLQYLEMTDIYIATSLNPNQAVSGTLSYAMGMGKAIVSTAFTQAKELVTRDSGILVEPKQPEKYTQALLCLLNNNPLRRKFSKNAYIKTRNMLWPNVALQHAKLFAVCNPDLNHYKYYKRLPPIKIDHFKRMTDNFGMFQFAVFSSPNRKFGYTLDDNARAAVALSLYYEKRADHNKELEKLIEIYVNFVAYCAKPDGTFENYVNYDKQFNEEANKKDSLEDALSRTLYALAFISTTKNLPQSLKDKMLALLPPVLPKVQTLQWSRARAHTIKALAFLIKSNVFDQKEILKNVLIQHADALIKLYNDTHHENWLWFEPYLTYANALLPEALFYAYDVTQNKMYLDVAKKTLHFLISVCFEENIYHPIGQSHWYYKESVRSYFDQQPEDTSQMIQALKIAYDLTQDENYKTLIHHAFNWFLGDNAITRMVYDVATGGCCDGIGKDAINLNQGAESTVSYLLARLVFLDFT